MSAEEQELVQPKNAHDPYAKPVEMSDDESPKAGSSKNNSKKHTNNNHKNNNHIKNNSSKPRKPSSNDAKELETPNDNYFFWSAFIIEMITIILYAVSADYEDASTNKIDSSRLDYGPYQDVHVMIFIGFGFLMTFLRKYGFGSVSFNLLIGAIALQWGLLVFHWIATGNLWDSDYNENRLIFDTHMLVDGDIAGAAVLISMGAVLGRTSPTQLIWMAFIELIIFSFNFYICVEELHITDVGGSIVVHAFGAYFGLAVSYVLGEPKKTDDNKSMYHSDLFAMIGTLFLWVFWPSFNGYFASDEGFYRDRAFINTVLSLSACTVSAFMFSKWFRNGKFDMVHVQNATLAGGVAVGAAADLYIHPAGALGVGFIAGFISVWGYSKLHDNLEHYLNLWDTCGVHNLHGMPGVMGGIVSAIAIWIVGSKDNKEDIYLGGFNCRGDDTCNFYYDWGKQGAMQIAAIFVTLGISIVGGLIVGFIIKYIDINNYYKVKSWYHDNDNFVVPKGKTTDIFRGTIRGQQFSRTLDEMDEFDDDE